MMMWRGGSQCVQLLVLISSLAYFGASDDVEPQLSVNCSRDKIYSSSVAYEENRNSLLSKLKSESLTFNYYNYTWGIDNNTIYGSYLCQGRLPNTSCYDCVSDAFEHILDNCPTQPRASIWYNNCTLKYSNDYYFGELVEKDWITWCSYGAYIKNSSEFKNVLDNTLSKVAKQAAGDDEARFATLEVDITYLHDMPTTLYTSAQCAPDISIDDCNQCLEKSIAEVDHFCNSTINGRTICSSCIIRYDVTRFYTAEPDKVAAPPATAVLAPLLPNPPTGNGSHNEPKGKGKGLYLSLGIVTPTLVILTLGLWCYFRNRDPPNKFDGIDMEEITSAESFQMDFNKVVVATLNFAHDMKLGEGGFGGVYKGTLENGQEIAVKRLTTSNSEQGAAEFKNEVVLVAKLQHRNLVKLLGFCLSAKEKILVYEYLSNSSLDKVLFDPIKKMSLDWAKRFSIICGVAKGLLYLHEDSRLRIIHRDLKSSNILLDEDMNPKISDFGIAKTLALDQTQASTEILAGTYGYMAPEYVLTGQYSLKSDVYSFGVMVLEIVSGQRNRCQSSPLAGEPLIHRAWRLWNKNSVLEMLDSTLSDAYSMEEVVKSVHIGLLCIQEDAGKRPKMNVFVGALSGKSVDLLEPAPPFFVNSSHTALVPYGSTTSTTSSHIATSSSQSSFVPILVDE